MDDNWIIYVLRCSDNSLYTGITKNMDKRLMEHNSGGKLGAKYTRSRVPVAIVYTETKDTRSEASKREYEIKQMSKESKERLVSGYDRK